MIGPEGDGFGEVFLAGFFGGFADACRTAAEKIAETAAPDTQSFAHIVLMPGERTGEHGRRHPPHSDVVSIAAEPLSGGTANIELTILRVAVEFLAGEVIFVVAGEDKGVLDDAICRNAILDEVIGAAGSERNGSMPSVNAAESHDSDREILIIELIVKI